MRNQLFHLPASDGRFDPCDIKNICTNDTHDETCKGKCHEDHQQIAVKGHGGKVYVLVDDHGSHTIVEDDLTSDTFDGLQHLKENVLPDVSPDCADCEFEVWTPQNWNREVQRIAAENVKRAEKNEPLLTQVDRRHPASVT